jgi:ankyrin repeat protein
MDRSLELFESIKANDAAKTRELLSLDPTLANARMDSGLTAVLLAVYYGRKEIVELLLASGARLNLFEASATGKLDRVEEILNEQPDLVNEYAPDGFTPLGLASFFGHTEVVRLLLARRAQVNIASNNPQRVMPLHSAVAARHFAIAQALLEHGAEVNAKQQEGFTPLHEAAQNGQLEMVQLLLQHGADVDAPKDDGQTALAIAEQHGRQDVADLLRQHGAIAVIAH